MNPGLGIPDDYEEVMDMCVDSSNDCGVDFFIRVDDHNIIIQTKFRGKNNKIENDDEVMGFMQCFKKLHPKVGKKIKKNNKLDEILADVNWKTDSFELIFITTGKGNDSINNLEDKGIEKFNEEELDEIHDRTSFKFLGEEQLNIEYRDVLSGKDLADVKLKFTKSEEIFWLKHVNNDDMTTYIGSMNAGQIHQIYTRHKSKLFNLNIRNFIGSTSTNKGIIETTLEEPENFFFYNNGLSAVAKEIIEDNENGSLACNSFSVINGAQTLRSISKSYSRNIKLGTEIKKVEVMIRVTEIPKLLKKTEILDKSTEFNNTQNVVKISDFRSNDSVQISLKKFFDKKSYRGQKYNYANKRTAEKNKNQIQVRLDDFCKIIYSFLYGPPDFSGGLKNLYDTSEEGGYSKLFGDPKNHLSTDTLTTYAAIYFFCEEIIKKFKHIKKDREAKETSVKDEGEEIITLKALQTNYLILYTISQILLLGFKEKGFENLEEYFLTSPFRKPEWKDDKKLTQFANSLVKLGCDILINIYQNNATQPNFIHRNFFRNKSTLKQITDSLLGHDSMIENIFKDI